MKSWSRVLQVAFTYMGTVVGAGFATGQEVLQFFTQFGGVATWTIFFSCLLFIWIGTKLMLMSQQLQAKSYEDLNIFLFGPLLGKAISLLILVMLLLISSVMLAGSGALFLENFQFSYQFGLLLTCFLAYAVMRKGMNGIIAVNSIVVPMMFVYTLFILYFVLQSPQASNWYLMPHIDSPLWRIWLSPFLYTAYNLLLSQAILVPLGTTIRDRKTIIAGGIVGGIGIGIMLWVGHVAISSQMPGIAQFDIPMSQVITHLSLWIQLIFILLIFAEIFTTFIADIYGLTLQLSQRLRVNRYPHLSTRLIILSLIAFCYLLSQFGFKTLLSTLYPLFGMISLTWLFTIMGTQLKNVRQK